MSKERTSKYLLLKGNLAELVIDDARLGAINVSSEEVGTIISCDASEDIIGYESDTSQKWKNGDEIWAEMSPKRQSKHNLSISVSNGNIEAVKSIIAKYPELLTEKPFIEQSFLLIAIENGHSEVAKYFIKTLPPCALDKIINYKDNGKNILHLAAISGLTEIGNLLLDIKPNLIEGIENSNDFTVLHIAASHGNILFVNEMMDKFPNMIHISSKVRGLTAFHLAAINNHVELIKMMMNKTSGDVNVLSNEGKNAFIYASEYKNLELAEMLSEKGSYMQDMMKVIFSNICIIFSQQGLDTRQGLVNIIYEYITYIKINPIPNQPLMMNSNSVCEEIPYIHYTEENSIDWLKVIEGSWVEEQVSSLGCMLL